MIKILSKKIIIVLAIVIVVSAVIVVPFYFTRESDINIQITNSTNIDIYFKQYGGLVPIEQAILELLITNDGNVRVIFNNIDGFPIKEYRGELTRTQLIDFTNLLLDNNYFGLNEEYSIPEGIAVMDAGIAEINITIDSENKKITINPNITTYLPDNLKNILNELITIRNKIIDDGNTVPLKTNIFGKVTDLNGNYIPDIDIRIIKGTEIFSTIIQKTNAEGEFEFIEVLPGIYTIAATDKNDRIQTTIINVKLGDSNNVNFILLPPSSKIKFSQIIWQKFGGIAGISEELIIASDGTISFRSNILKDTKNQLTVADIDNLIELVDKAKIFSVNNKSYTAKNGVADFFIYSLTLNLNGEVKSIAWVDDWASEDTLPQDLRDIQSYIENIVKEIN